LSFNLTRATDAQHDPKPSVLKATEVFTSTIEPVDLNDGAVHLGPDGRVIYIVRNGSISLMDWGTGTTAAAPLVSPNCNVHSGLRLLWVGTVNLVVDSCSALFLLDSRTLETKQVLQFDPRRQIEEFGVSPDSRWMAVGSFLRLDPSNRELELFDMPSWRRLGSLGPYLGPFAFTGNSKHLVVRTERKTLEGNQQSLEVRRLPKGQIIRSWRPTREEVVSGRMQFMRNSPYRMVTGVKNSDALIMSNVLQGAMIKTLMADRSIVNALLDPAGRWAIAEVLNRDGTHGLQAWDMSSGTIAFEGEAVIRNEKRISLIGLSDSGEHLLVRRGNQHVVFEIVYESASPR
jgi:hypothetical protein